MPHVSNHNRFAKESRASFFGTFVGLCDNKHVVLFWRMDTRYKRYYWCGRCNPIHILWINFVNIYFTWDKQCICRCIFCSGFYSKHFSQNIDNWFNSSEYCSCDNSANFTIREISSSDRGGICSFIWNRCIKLLYCKIAIMKRHWCTEVVPWVLVFLQLLHGRLVYWYITFCLEYHPYIFLNDLR